MTDGPTDRVTYTSRWSRLKMENTHLTKKILQWDIKLGMEKNIPTWSSDVKAIFERNDVVNSYENVQQRNIKDLCKQLLSSLNKKVKQS